MGNGLAFDLLSPASFGQQLILTQLVTISRGQESQQLLFYSEINASGIGIAGLLPDGTRLFSINYDGRSLQSEGNREALARLDPRYLLADMQIALWPLADVRSGFELANDCFAEGNCQLVETEDQTRRTLVSDGGVIVDIHYQGTPHYGVTTHYQHRSRAYDLRIETLHVELLGEAVP